MSYCDVPTLKGYMGIASGKDDGLLEGFITRAQGSIETGWNRKFEASADTTRYLDAVNDVCKESLFLDRDLCQITSITNGDGVVVSSNSYVTEPRNETPWYEIRLKGSSGLAWTYDDDPENAITIVGRWAYSVTAPPAVEQACIRLAAWLYRQKDTSKDNNSDRPILSMSGAVILPSQMPQDVIALMKPFKKDVV